MIGTSSRWIFFHSKKPIWDLCVAFSILYICNNPHLTKTYLPAIAILCAMEWHCGTGSVAMFQGRGRSHEANAGGVLRRKLLGDLSPLRGPWGWGWGGHWRRASRRKRGSWEAIWEVRMGTRCINQNHQSNLGILKAVCGFRVYDVYCLWPFPNILGLGEILLDLPGGIS